MLWLFVAAGAVTSPASLRIFILYIYVYRRVTHELPAALFRRDNTV